MSAYKYIINLVVLATVLLTINTVPATGSVASSNPADKTQHHLIVGQRIPGDRLVLKQDVFRNAVPWKQYVERTFNVLEWERITKIEALDWQNENGAWASIVEGGPGHSSVTIQFESVRDRRINFLVNVYALNYN